MNNCWLSESWKYRRKFSISFLNFYKIDKQLRNGRPRWVEMYTFDWSLSIPPSSIRMPIQLFFFCEWCFHIHFIYLFSEILCLISCTLFHIFEVNGCWESNKLGENETKNRVLCVVPGSCFLSFFSFVAHKYYHELYSQYLSFVHLDVWLDFYPFPIIASFKCFLAKKNKNEKRQMCGTDECAAKRNGENWVILSSLLSPFVANRKYICVACVPCMAIR